MVLFSFFFDFDRSVPGNGSIRVRFCFLRVLVLEVLPVSSYLEFRRYREFLFLAVGPVSR